MASEVLAVPEYALQDTINVIRAGLKTVKVPSETKKALLEWCKEEEAYLKDMESED